MRFLALRYFTVQVRILKSFTYRFPREGPQRYFLIASFQNIGTQGVRELFFCDLKPPGGSSTQWTLKSYDKGNSFTYTGPGLPAFNVTIEFNFLVQTLMIVVPKYFATILQNNTFPSFSHFELISQRNT